VVNEWEIILLLQNSMIEERAKKRILKLISREERLARRIERLKIRKMRRLNRVIPQLA
jgi:hypothetical protein